MSEQMTQLHEAAGIDPEKPMFPISVLADILGVHQRTLRIYDDENILVPSRSPKNRRLYSLNDVERSKFVQYLTRDLGINLAGIRIIFSLLDQLKVPPSKYIDHISDIAKTIRINAGEQGVEKPRGQKRGRKPKKPQVEEE